MLTSCYLPAESSLIGNSIYAITQRGLRREGRPALTGEAYRRSEGAVDDRARLWMFVEGGGQVLGADGRVRPRRLVVYHGRCWDGFGAAWAVNTLLGDVEFRAAVYGEPPVTEDEVRGRDVLFVDFAYDRETMTRLHDAAGHLWVLDHHATAAAALDGLSWCTFNLERSGAGLAWDHLAPLFARWASVPEPVRPWIVDYVEDRDLWRHRLPLSREVNAFLGTLPFEFESWTGATALGATQAALMGGAVLAGVRRYVREMRDQAAVGFLGGHLVPCVNAPEVHVSELLCELAAGQPFAVGYFRRGDGLWKYSLRSDDQGLDVSQIAQRFGGGGHPHAAGFQLAEELSLDLRSRPRLALAR